MHQQRLLSDGTAVVLRAIEPGDKDELQAGLHRLSPEAVHRRFMAPKVSFSRAELRYLTEVDGHDHAAIVAELADQPGTIVAVGRYVRLADEPDVAEAAIVVADFLQRKGLGTILAEALATEAVLHDIRRFSATMQGDNRAAQRLMARLTDQLELHPDGAGAGEARTELVA